MNLTVLKYIIEVEKCSSITAAARQLFISQPNLSRDIRDLEEEIGFSIFTRNSRGVVPTDRGREFLLLARRTIRQYQMLENYCRKEDRDCVELHICVPSASYITSAFTAFLCRHARGKQLLINYRETDALSAIRCVTEHNCRSSIIRYPDKYEKALLPLLRQKELSYETLYRFEPVVLMSARHPLAGASELTADLLERSTEVICEDTSLSAVLHEVSEPDSDSGCIRVHERGSQFDILTGVPGTHMFVSPVPDEIRKRYDLVQKKYHGIPRRMTDLLIYPEGGRLGRAELLFLDLVREAAHGLA